MNETLPPLTPGTLYLVATPIGNLEDITLRALRTLKECDVVAAEDTRRTGQLLKHFGISKPMLSYFQFNEAKRSEEIIGRLQRGEKVALVTDAGSPGISDPGERVVKAAVAAGFRVESVPGPSALVAALTASGLPTDEFHFIGFLPEKAGARRTRLEELAALSAKADATCTLIFYEAPHRILDTLADLEAVWGPDLHVVVARELTKIHEEFLRTTVAAARQQLASRDRIRGEITLLVAPPAQALSGTRASVSQKIADRIAQIQAEAGVDEKEALKRLARELGQSKSDVYRELQRERARLTADSRGTRNAV